MNAEEKRTYMQIWRSEHPGEVKEYRRKWRNSRPHYQRDWKRKQKLEHPEKYETAIRFSLASKQRRREAVMRILGTVCYVCAKSDRLGLHHLSYPNGEPKNQYDRLKEAEEHPELFRLLCSSCHFTVTVLADLNVAVLTRLDEVVGLTRGFMGISQPKLED